MDKYEYYEKVWALLRSAGFNTEPYREINYGIQFNVSIGGKKELLRIYESKKGIKLDLSQVRDNEVLRFIKERLNEGSDGEKNKNNNDPDRLIGTDESGKGDYFGPLVIAGVYVDPSTSSVLQRMGVDDSKKLSDSKIANLSCEIKNICPYTIVAIQNAKYNELYNKFKNLNLLLAWGHARAIENVLNVVECGHALSDQFGNPSLIKNALMEKGRKIMLEQRHRAEENIAVAAASILARNEYVLNIKEMEEKYNMVFPKGASQMVSEAARVFIEKYGMDELVNVAKLHFKTTGQF